ncbi:MAG: flagellar protein FliT [Polaromonas sp.]
MSSQSEVMHCYEQIATLTEGMLTQARTSQWGELPAQELMYSDMVDRLKFIEPQESLLEEQVARKYQLLSRIVSNQSEISNLVMPHLAHLGQVLKSLEQQENLQKAYGQAADIRL